MKEWKVRQEVFYRLHQDKVEDWLASKTVIEKELNDEELVEQILRHFNEDIGELEYPAKSYMVAMVYAKRISEEFGEDFLETLSDPELLNKQDPWFQTYAQKKSVYEKVLRRLPEPWPESWQVKETKKYFAQEFMLGQP